MDCTHCGGRPDADVRKLVFHRSGTRLELTLCDECLADLLAESDIEIDEGGG